MTRKVEGFSMVEMLVAIGVVVVVMVTLSSGVSVSIRNTRYSKEKALSVRKAQEGIEWVRKQRDSMSWRAFTDVVKADGLGEVVYCLESTEGDEAAFVGLTHAGVERCEGMQLVDGVYSREVSLTVNGVSSVDVQVGVSWEGGSGVESTELKTRLLDLGS